MTQVHIMMKNLAIKLMEVSGSEHLSLVTASSTIRMFALNLAAIPSLSTNRFALRKTFAKSTRNQKVMAANYY